MFGRFFFYMDTNFVINADFIIKTYFENKNQIFNTHQFIEKYRTHFQHEYIAWLTLNLKDEEPSFRVTNNQIVNLLRKNQRVLGIFAHSVSQDRSDLGKVVPVTNWKKL